jgi:adenylate cyclase
MLVAHALPPITMKGISRDVIPYTVEGMLDATGQTSKVFSAHMTGLDFYLDPRMVNANSADQIRLVLQQALTALEKPAAG